MEDTEDDQDFKDYEQTLQFITSIKIQLQKVSDKAKNLEQILAKIKEQILINHISVIIVLHDSKLLVHFLECCLSKLKDKKSDLYKQIQIISDFGYGCFFRHLPLYNNIFNSLRNGKEFDKSHQDLAYLRHTGPIARYEEMKTILAKLFKIKNLKQQFLTRLAQLDKFVVDQCLRFKAQSSFEEVFLTWVRQEVEQLQNQIHSQNKISKYNGLCCRLHFSSGQSITGLRVSSNHFINSQEKGKIKDSEHYRKYFKQSIVGYLNAEGGVISLGVEYDVKKIIIKGVQMKAEERIQILSWLVREVFLKIFPDPQQQLSQDFKAIENRSKQKMEQIIKKLSISLKKSNYQYLINDYISIDFVPVYKDTTLLQLRTDKLKVYVVRIKIKPGKSYEVYHFINDKDTPQAVYREGNKEKVLTFQEYYQEVYRKLRLKAKGQTEDTKYLSHPYCRLYYQIQTKDSSQRF